MFQIRGVTRTFPSRPEPVRALRGVDLDVADGDLTAILGPSGCGKTTLLRILAGFDRPDSGEVRLGGEVVAGPGVFVKPEKRSVGIVAQEGALFPHLSVAANIAYGLPGGRLSSLRAADRAKRAERVEEMLRLVGLPGYGDRRPAQLSGGQQQRVALARALAPAPSVILLDEPFSALDAALRVDLREEVRDLLRSIRTTAVLVTHDQNEALSLADNVALMRDGRVVQAGTPHDMYAHPADPEAAAFLGDSVQVACEVVATDDTAGTATVQCALGTLRVTRDAVHDQTLVLRPEQIEIADSGVPARVAATRYFGHDGLVQLTLGDGTPLRLRIAGDHLPAVDADVKVRAIAAG
ncbi:ABC transporter ATP-binding protein [Gordonia sp. (in: high G+C Gram-positive bacteria)]|uniref:ABC transporter ATP-binding protein n=1 Tax=Gordonia sp. (in: high G+C Gram-positive bacteria) TaxID=84139 RepID=UPI00168FDE2C|nr:ABC transporter ATP-binding protein [Gordonia sp. (in: high G+C Gram-positive bacteria)]NLG46223.1 ABC transporter ATP-binding protein [Gordonia sp. (in: high G+C Gram-positive bacteria)]